MWGQAKEPTAASQCARSGSAPEFSATCPLRRKKRALPPVQKKWPKSRFSRDSRESREFRDSREPSRIQTFSLEILENLEISEILEMLSVKRPLRNDPFFQSQLSGDVLLIFRCFRPRPRTSKNRMRQKGLSDQTFSTSGFFYLINRVFTRQKKVEPDIEYVWFEGVKP